MKEETCDVVVVRRRDRAASERFAAEKKAKTNKAHLAFLLFEADAFASFSRRHAFSRHIRLVFLCTKRGGKRCIFAKHSSSIRPHLFDRQKNETILFFLSTGAVVTVVVVCSCCCCCCPLNRLGTAAAVLPATAQAAAPGTRHDLGRV